MSRYIMKQMIPFRLLGLLVGLMVVTTGCTSSPEALETESDFTGFITDIRPIGEKGTLGQVSVESHTGKLVNKYIVTIRRGTPPGSL